MMEIIRGAVLGLVQGLTEFFPVSSSGHLILFPRLFGWPDQGAAFDTVMHLGTLAALLWFFRRDLSSMFRDRGLLKRIAVATAPALAIGGALGGVIERYTREPTIIVWMLAFWGAMLFVADRFSQRTDAIARTVGELSWKHALIVGCAQPLAFIPGTSRSGVTITAGLFAGLSRETAARFSFLLSIPVTAAAGLHGLFGVVRHGSGSNGMIALLVGFLAAAASGAWAIRFLLSYVAKKRYDAFVAYRLALALVVWLVL